MGQLQFQANDTVKWREQYGNRVDGDASLSGVFTNPNASFSGVEGASTGVVDSSTGFAIGNIVLIHQSRDGGDGAGVWQLNKITNIFGTTFEFKYPLMNDYATTAQIVKISQHRNITIGSTLSSSPWNGIKGGIIVLMGNLVTVNAPITLNGADGIQQNGGVNTAGGGYRGGGGSVDVLGGDAGQAEGETGSGGAISRNNNGSGGGGGSGGVGSGIGGVTYQTDTDLSTHFVFGGGGGGANTNDGGSLIGAAGGNGGGLILIIAKTITIANTINLNGGNGTNGTVNGGSGGGGGGSALLKGQRVTLGTNQITALGGTGGSSGAGDAGGGGAGATTAGDKNGTNGTVHIDYSTSLSGTTIPTLSSTVDKTLLAKYGNAGLILLRDNV